jgi:SNF2 family DNA or RNA helicase
MTERFVEITPEQKRLLKIVAKGASADPNAPYIKTENVLEKVLRARQIVGGWLPKGKIEWKEIEGQPVETITTELIPLDKNPKMDGLFELVEDNFDGSKFIIWSTFVHEIEAIRDLLIKKYGSESVECYYGGTAMEDRSRIEDRYCNDATLRFFIGHPTAAGLGLTLISGENDVMVYYSGTNAYIDRAQSEDRAHRIGQKNTVTIVDLIAEKTIDEVIVESIRGKMDVETYVTTKIRDGNSIVDLLVRD